MPDSRDRERDAVAQEIADRLRRRGVRISGDESSEQLVELLEAVESFERAVERAGGDLMVDEPSSPDRDAQPDDGRFVLPRRRANESVRDFIDRIESAASEIQDA